MKEKPREQQIKALQSHLSEGLSQSSRVAPQSNQLDSESKKTGRWTMDEHFRFIEALQLYGKEWKRVQ